MVVKKKYRYSKSRIKKLGLLMTILLFPIILNSYFISFYDFKEKFNKEDIVDNLKEPDPIISLKHPISADDFGYFKYITIDHTKVSGTANLLDFPLLISILDSDLHDHTQLDGDDIAFSVDYQWLDHEIELFNQLYNSTHAQLISWVRIPVLSHSEDTVIRMYYGNPLMENRENPKGLWDNNYKGVWHLGEINGGSSAIKDSTLNANHGTDNGSPSFDSPGAIDSAIDFKGNIEDEYVELPNSVSLNSISEGDYFTYEAWFNPDQVPPGIPPDDNNHRYGVLIKKDPHQGIYYDRSQVFTMEHWLDIGGVPTVRSVSSSTFVPGSFYHLVGVVSNLDGYLKLYVNGNLEAETNWTGGTNPWVYGSKHLRIGIANPGASIYRWPADGKIDEVRISDNVRSASWIATEYSNLYDPDNFISVSNGSNVYVPNIYDFTYFKEITIDHIKVSGTSDLINFPALVSIFDKDLHDKVQPDGDDIMFNNGTSWLFHEIEMFNQNYNSTHAQLIVWINLPKLSPFEDTVIRMYYGNATMQSQESSLGVWDSDYVGIWHLSESGNGTLNEYKDSTRYGNHGQGGNGTPSYIPTRIDGTIGYGQNFNDHFIDCGNDTVLDITGNQISLQLWMKFPASHPWMGPFNHKGYYDGYRMVFDVNSQILRFQLHGQDYNLQVAQGLSTDVWHHVVATYDGSFMKVYVDGLQDINTLAKSDNILSASPYPFRIGHADYPEGVAWTYPWLGQIDEVRVSKVARSADWIKTEYNNQFNLNEFYSLSNETLVADDVPLNEDYFIYYKIIKIDHRRIYGSGGHSNFPLLISLVDNDLRFDVQPDGDDIAFSLGSIWLDHEIELFNQNFNATHAELITWVRIPELSTSLDTYLRMYYGNATMESRQNPAGVWDPSYKGVWHLKESSGFTQDSTSYNENGIVSGTLIRPSVGQVGNGYNYGTDGTYNVGDPSDGHLDFSTESFMVSMWINVDTSTGDLQIPLYKGASSTWDPGYCFGTPITGNSIGFYITDGTSNAGSPSASITFDSWIYIVGIVDRTKDLIRIYKNGTEVGIGTDISGILSLTDTQNLDFQCAHPNYDFDGLLDEVRVLNQTRSKDWIKTEYYNQFDPNSLYDIGQEQNLKGIKYSDLQVNALDFFGNTIPDVNISVYNNTILLYNSLTNNEGIALFPNIVQGDYNFTATITSSIGGYIENVNTTTEAIVINQTFQTLDLICNVGSNFFSVVDIDGIVVNTGWLIVGNSTHDIQNCSIDGTGQTRFWWLKTSPYEYNYTLYYKDNKYYPNIIEVASGNIITENSSIQIHAALTTIDFTILTLLTKQPVSGVKCLLSSISTSESVVNLTTDNQGKATLRWLNSTGINGNYSLQLEFFGSFKLFNMTDITKTLVTEVNFTVSAEFDYTIYVEISLGNYQTELISLNPTEYISVTWGTQVRLMMLFNVSKAIGAEHLLGPLYSDEMSYQIFKGADFILSGTFSFENDYEGIHYAFFNTEQLESDITYLIVVSAQKSGYSLPEDRIIQLNVLKNDIILNQSQNDDSIQSVYWAESVDLSVKPYGEITETLTSGTSIFQNIDHSFRISLPELSTNWNLSRIVLNIYNISWNVNASAISLSILNPYGVNTIFNTSNHAGWDYNLGVWEGITLNLNKGSPFRDNNFEFFISGTFDNTIDVIANAYFIRDHIDAQYVKFNNTDCISILSEFDGWAMKNISFYIQNCYNTTTWQKVDLSTLTNLNISTVEGVKYSLYSGDVNGNGLVIMDDRLFYPKDNQFLFLVESDSAIVFDVVINVEYIQVYYQNPYLETFNITNHQQNIANGGMYNINLNKNDWEDNFALLLINEIKNGSQYFLPTQVAMTITIGGQTYQISNTLIGQGTFSLEFLNKDTLYNAIIETSIPVNFSLSLKLGYSRTAYYEVFETVTFLIREAGNINGVVAYNSDLGYYLQTIDTSQINANYYTIRFEVSGNTINSAIKDLDINVMDRITLINGQSTIAKVIDSIYVKDTVNFTFLYTDSLTGARVSDLQTKYYMWERYDIHGNVTDSGEGILIQTYFDAIILDFDTENRIVGEYLIILTVEKQNYENKNALIRLSIMKRELDYSLGNNFNNFQISVVQGKTVSIQLNLTDPTQRGIPLLNATVLLTIKGIEYQFIEFANGIYGLNYSTRTVNAFFSPTTLVGYINITKEDYISEEFRITIVVKMEEIFPGFPTFYFLIIIFGILAIVGSIVGYRVIKHAKIPKFVKNVREIQKEIKGGKEISDSLLYSPKEVFVGEIVRDKWSSIGLSLGEILGIEIKKSKKLPGTKRTKTERVHDFKPLGLLLMKWDERIGTEILVKYPESLVITEKTLMQVYSTHEYSGEKGVINLTIGLWNILSYYTGPDLGYYVILFLELDDDPDLYEGAMADTAHVILQNISDDSYLQMIPSLFQRISGYPNLTEEQQYFLFYQDEIKHMIIEILRNYGVITKSELIIWVKERELVDIIDLESILAQFIKSEIIKVRSVKGIPSDLIFLTKDIFMLRVPPTKLFAEPDSHGLPAKLTKEYQAEVQKVFNEYRPSEEDTLSLLNILIDPEVYETLRLLRMAIVTMQDFEKLKNRGVGDIYSVLRKLWDTQMIKVLKDESGIEYYTLITDIYIDVIFPKYQLNLIKLLNNQKSKSDKVLIQYLNVLEETYLDKT
ncbi:MAG: DUF2341 domain-containing protein [Promethearchaeota archaeon]